MCHLFCRLPFVIFIVGGRRQQTSNVLIEIIVNSNLRKEENYIFIQKESIYDNVLWVVGLFMKFYFLLKTRAFVSHEKHELWSFCGHICEQAGRSKGRSLVYLGLYWSRWWVTNRAQFKNSSHFTFTLFKGRMEVRAVSVHEMPHSLWNLLLKFVRVSHLCAVLNNSQKVGGKIT